MATPTKKPATYQDLLEVKEHQVGELVDRELFVSPRPASLHTRAASALGGELAGPFNKGRGGPGGWIILDEPELHLVEQVMVPDLAGWRRERMPVMPDAVAFELAPDWLCEVLSPSTEAFDRAKKMPHYARAHVQHVWLIKPESKALEVFRLDGQTYRFIRAFIEDNVRAEPFDAVELELAALWAR